MGNICFTGRKSFSRCSTNPTSPEYGGSSLNINSFNIEKVLSSSNLGKVLLVTKSDTGEKFVIKSVKKSKLLDPKVKKHTMNERAILIQAKSEFKIKLIYAFQNSLRLYFVLEYMEGGDLLKYLKARGRITHKAARFYIAETLLALEDLHSEGIIYRDLKPENILVGKDGHIKLTDFNMAKITSSEDLPTRTICGTPEYMAPETIKGCHQTYRVDHWSLGVLFYEMIEGITPFFHKNHQELYLNILEGKIRTPCFIRNKAFHVIQTLLNLSPSKRPEISDIKLMPFFKGIDWSAARNKSLSPPFIPRNEAFLNESDVLDCAVSPQQFLAPHSKNIRGFSFIAQQHIAR